MEIGAGERGEGRWWGLGRGCFSSLFSPFLALSLSLALSLALSLLYPFLFLGGGDGTM